MKKSFTTIGVLLALAGFVGMSQPEEAAAVSQAPEFTVMYRLYNPTTGEHFYTASVTERNSLTPLGWQDEGIGWYAPTTGNEVYRLYNPNSGDHHYTLSFAESLQLAGLGWKQEGVGWYSDTSQSVPLYRVFNPNATTATHHYTTNLTERNQLLPLGWQEEGVAWYGVQVNDGTGNDTTNPTPTPPATEQATLDVQSSVTVKPLEYVDLSGLVISATKEDGSRLIPNIDLKVSQSATTITGDYTSYYDVTYSYKNLSKTTRVNVVDPRPDGFDYQTFETTFYNLVNNHRIANGKLPLASYDSDVLQTISDVRVKELGMVWGHNRPNGQYVYDIIPETRYENMFNEIIYAMGTNSYTDDPVAMATRVFEGFKNSSIHNDILLKGNDNDKNMRLAISVHFKTNNDVSAPVKGNSIIYFAAMIGNEE